jgi:hypothetical protein
MGRTEEEFVRYWRHHIGGLALFGHVSEIRDTLEHRARRAMEIPAETEELLRRMYRWLEGKPSNGTTKKETTNGTQERLTQPRGPARS